MNPTSSCYSVLGAFALIAAACNPDTPRDSNPAGPAPAVANARAEFDLGKPA